MANIIHFISGVMVFNSLIKIPVVSEWWNVYWYLFLIVGLLGWFKGKAIGKFFGIDTNTPE